MVPKVLQGFPFISKAATKIVGNKVPNVFCRVVFKAVDNRVHLGISLLEIKILCIRKQMVLFIHSKIKDKVNSNATIVGHRI